MFTYTAAGELSSVADMLADANGTGMIFFCNFAYNTRGQLEQRKYFPGTPSGATRSPAMNATFNADNQLATVSSGNVTHDLRGNLTSGPLPSGLGQGSYNFDARNRLIGLSGGSVSASYAYDPGDARISVTEGGVTSLFSVAPLGGLGQVTIEQRGTLERVYVYTPNGQLLYDVETSTSTTSTEVDDETGDTVTLTENPVRYYHYDITGSTVALSNAQGTLIGRVFYTPYGEITKREGAMDTRFLFCGAYGVQTDASGLVHMRARYYHPHLCRFISEDPIGFEGGVNVYAYVSGMPLMANDPDGEILNFIIGAAVNVVVGGAIRMATGGEFFDGRAMAMDAAIGAATSGVAAFANVMRGAGTAAKIIHQTRAFDAVRNSSRLWGKTEGVVWGLSEAGGRSMINRGVNGSIQFVDDAARLFHRRPIEGVWSGFKNWQGQYVTRFGDLAWDAARASQLAGNNLLVGSAQVVAHSPQWAGQAMRNYWGTKALDQFVTSLTSNTGRILWGAVNGDTTPGNFRGSMPCGR
jgi:RHS repeat-associated protein